MRKYLAIIVFCACFIISDQKLQAACSPILNPTTCVWCKEWHTFVFNPRPYVEFYQLGAYRTGGPYKYQVVDIDTGEVFKSGTTAYNGTGILSMNNYELVSRNYRAKACIQGFYHIGTLASSGIWYSRSANTPHNVNTCAQTSFGGASSARISAVNVPAPSYVKLVNHLGAAWSDKAGTATFAQNIPDAKNFEWQYSNQSGTLTVTPPINYGQFAIYTKEGGFKHFGPVMQSSNNQSNNGGTVMIPDTTIFTVKKFGEPLTSIDTAIVAQEGSQLYIVSDVLQTSRTAGQVSYSIPLEYDQVAIAVGDDIYGWYPNNASKDNVVIIIEENRPTLSDPTEVSDTEVSFEWEDLRSINEHDRYRVQMIDTINEGQIDEMTSRNIISVDGIPDGSSLIWRVIAYNTSGQQYATSNWSSYVRGGSLNEVKKTDRKTSTLEQPAEVKFILKENKDNPIKFDDALTNPLITNFIPERMDRTPFSTYPTD